MLLDKVIAELLVTNFSAYSNEENLNALRLVNRIFCILINQHRMNYYLGKPVNDIQIGNHTTSLLSFFSFAKPIPGSHGLPLGLITSEAAVAKCIFGLNNIRPKNAVQLRNIFRCIWYLNYGIRIWPSTPPEGLQEATQRIHAVIGQFSILKNRIKIDYNVSATARFFSPNDAQKFWFFGTTKIYIHEAAKPLPDSIVERRKLHGFSIINCIRQSDGSWTSEKFEDYNRKMDLSEQWFYVELAFRDVVKEHRGSNRELDQRVLQIIVEILQQNESKSYMLVESNHTDYPLLVMGGLWKRVIMRVEAIKC